MLIKPHKRTDIPKPLYCPSCKKPKWYGGYILCGKCREQD